MQLIRGLILSLGVGIVSAATWSFEDGSVSIRGKSMGADAPPKEKITPEKALSKPLSFSTGQTLKVVLTATNGKKPRRPHQAFLSIADPAASLEESYPFVIKDTGKATVDVPFNSIPVSLLTRSTPLKAAIIIGSFGSSKPYKADVFDLTIAHNPNLPIPQDEAPVRYGKLPEIHHVFRTDAKSPPKIITLVFLGAVLVTLPALFAGWLALGANLNHLSKALGAAPISHLLFVGGVVAMEGVFFMYYTSWNLFKTLPVAGVIAIVTFISGSRALTEVQERRIAGLR